MTKRRTKEDEPSTLERAVKAVVLTTAGALALSACTSGENAPEPRPTVTVTATATPEVEQVPEKVGILELDETQRQNVQDFTRESAIRDFMEVRSAMEGDDIYNGYDQLMARIPYNNNGEKQSWMRFTPSADGVILTVEVAVFNEEDKTVYDSWKAFINDSEEAKVAIADGILTTDEARALFDNPSTVFQNGSITYENGEVVQVVADEDGCVVEFGDKENVSYDGPNNTLTGLRVVDDLDEATSLLNNFLR